VPEQNPRLFLVDGSAYIFRAFFAIPPMNNSAGLPTNAIFGFTNALLKFLKQYQPEYVAVALDAGRETFRNQLFTAYKANRPEAPAKLIPQFPYFRRVLEGLKVPVLERQNYEADDIIATLCKTLGDNGCDLIVVSSDKDLMQLVSHRIKLLDGARNRWIGAEEVKFRFGVEPGQVVQVIGLMGDPVDNIPGVKGIGAKTAVALIRQFGTLENLFDRLNDIEESDLRNAARVRKFLDEGKDAAFLSRELATIRCDVPIAIELDQLRFTGFDQDKLRSLFNELEFTNLIKLLDHGRV
jgi:DNA polymerase-1